MHYNIQNTINTKCSTKKQHARSTSGSCTCAIIDVPMCIRATQPFQHPFKHAFDKHITPGEACRNRPTGRDGRKATHQAILLLQRTMGAPLCSSKQCGDLKFSQNCWLSRGSRLASGFVFNVRTFFYLSAARDRPMDRNTVIFHTKTRRHQTRSAPPNEALCFDSRSPC